jgi:hypothetical protein
MLGRLRLIPVWAAWAFALSSPLTIGFFAIHILVVRSILRYLILLSLLIGAAPAALTMLKTRGQTVSAE